MDAWDLRAANDQRREGLPRAAWVVDETAPHLDGPKRIKSMDAGGMGCDFILTKLRCNRGLAVQILRTPAEAALRETHDMRGRDDANNVHRAHSVADEPKAEAMSLKVKFNSMRKLLRAEMNCHLSSPLNKPGEKVESQASSAQRFNIKYHLRPGEGSTL
uniref:Uncharacterized protein n=1 Tax=Coccidioides posadasii RMSCC 3488 TaxID=454284 RepID=A0A0J6FK06_COCPO|nr:hypothetical protein CPAG_09798 [Coccidioides posadasii RMSCC 3488]